MVGASDRKRLARWARAARRELDQLIDDLRSAGAPRQASRTVAVASVSLRNIEDLALDADDLRSVVSGELSDAAEYLLRALMLLDMDGFDRDGRILLNSVGRSSGRATPRMAKRWFEQALGLLRDWVDSAA